MAKRTTKREHLEAICAGVGFYFATYSPGDGVTRYRFYPDTARDEDGAKQDYFSGDGEWTALGYAEAEVYAVGRRRGYLTGGTSIAQTMRDGLNAERDSAQASVVRNTDNPATKDYYTGRVDAFTKAVSFTESIERRLAH